MQTGAVLLQLELWHLQLPPASSVGLQFMPGILIHTMRWVLNAQPGREVGEAQQLPERSRDKELEELHSMLVPLDVGAADAVWTALYSLHSRLDAAQEERRAIAQAYEGLRVRSPAGTACSLPVNKLIVASRAACRPVCGAAACLLEPVSQLLAGCTLCALTPGASKRLQAPSIGIMGT